MVKGTAWSAGFPLANTVVSLNVGTMVRSDFVGVSMDLGFRLAKFATIRFVAVSVELLWWLSYSKKQAGTPWVDTIRLRYLQRHDLKGVGDTAYPIFVIDLGASELEIAEDSILGVRQQSPDEVRDFCRHFIEAHGVPRSLPFLFGQCRLPERYKQRLAAFHASIDKIFTEEAADFVQVSDGVQTETQDIFNALEALEISSSNDRGALEGGDKIG